MNGKVEPPARRASQRRAPRSGTIQPMGEPDRPLLLCFDGTEPAAVAARAAAHLLQPRRAVVAAV